MVEPISSSPNYVIARQMMDAAVLRQHAIASNIANADTPRYRRVDLSPAFAAELRTQVRNGEFNSIRSLKPSLTEDTAARSLRPDGNTVELDRELLEMNRNSVEYDFLTDIVSSNLKQLRLAIVGR